MAEHDDSRWPGAMAQKPLYAIGYGADWPRPKSTALFSTASRISSARMSPQATERARRMAARSCRQVQSRRAANPRPPARALRRQALVLAGSLLTNGFPHLCIDPDKLAAKGVDFETAATAQGFMEHGSRSDLRTCPNSISVSLAASRSRGPAGAWGRLPDLRISNRGDSRTRARQLLDADHGNGSSSQVVADSEVVMESHNSALDYIATELELIATGTEHPQPKGVDWAKVRPDQFADIPSVGTGRDDRPGSGRAV
jgi:5-formyltetrahydrofolate cyclo-ligase